MSLRPAALITSPTSILGEFLAKVLAKLGFDLVLLTWRSDKAEHLMHEILITQDRRVMVVRKDLAESWSVKELRKQILGANLKIDVIVAIPLVEENTAPFPREQREKLIITAQRVKDKVATLCALYPQAQVLNLSLLLAVKTRLKLTLLQWRELWR